MMGQQIQFYYSVYHSVLTNSLSYVGVRPGRPTKNPPARARVAPRNTGHWGQAEGKPKKMFAETFVNPV